MTGGGEVAATDSRDRAISVLVVDDDVDYAELTATYLERDTPFDVTTLYGGHDALDALSNGSDPDCIVSDHDMPGMNGLEFLASVRDQDPGQPFILFTGKGNEEIASEAVTAGVTDYVKKGGPEQYDVLANRVQNAVDRRRSEQALHEEKELLEQVLATTPGSIVCADNGEVTYATARAARTLGIDRDALVGAAWDDPGPWTYVDYNGNPLPPDERPISSVFETGEAVTDAEVAITKRDGERLYLAVDVAPLGTVSEPESPDRAVVSFRDVTDRIEHERQVVASEQKYQALVEALPDAVFLADAETGEIVEMNGRATELLDRDRDEILGMSQAELHPPGEADRYRRLFEDHSMRVDDGMAKARWFPDGSPVEVVTSDGTRKPVEIRATILELDGRRLIHGLFRDLSGEAKRQRELERTRTVLDAVQDGTYALDADGRFTYVNDALASLSGYEADELVRSHSSIIIDDEDVEAGRELIESLLQDDRERGIIEMEIHRKDGSTVPVENHIAVLPTMDGEFRGTAGIARDISERLEQERRLRESEQKYSSVVEEANDGVVIAQDDVIKFVNPKACDILNGDESDLLGKPIPAVVAPDDREKVADRLRRRLSGEDPERRYEFTALALDGEQVPIEFTASVITYEGDPAVLAICRDISERKQRERELEQYETIVQTAPDGVFIVDEEANYVGGNIPGAELTGYTQEELFGKSVPELVEEGVFGEEVIPRYTNTVKHLLSSENDDTQGKFEFSITREGETRTYECHVSIRPFDPDQGESFRGSIGVLRDVTERNRRERELERQNERLEDFANVVGHDLRNPLNVATGNLELARTGSDAAFDRVAEAHARMSEMLDDLLALARTGQAVEEREAVSLHDLAESAWATVDTADATLELESDLVFQAEPGRVRQLFENLFGNAVAHVGPTVTVTVDALPDDPGFCVVDDGPGIDPDIQEDVFEPGFTTRSAGTGFGLAIVEDIADAHGWDVTLGDDDGACVEVRFEITDVEIET